jgi:uncharacterized membrane protein
MPTISQLIPNTGPASGGNTINIFGSGFTGATAVNFGVGNPAPSFTVVTDNLIQAVVPSGTGVVPVTVVTPAGTSNGVLYTYASPVISFLVPTSGPASGGNTVNIFGSGLTGATAVNFGVGNPAPSFTVVTDNLIQAVAPSGSGTVQVTVVTPGGTSNSASYT